MYNLRSVIEAIEFGVELAYHISFSRKSCCPQEERGRGTPRTGEVLKSNIKQTKGQGQLDFEGSLYAR